MRCDLVRVSWTRQIFRKMSDGKLSGPGKMPLCLAKDLQFPGPFDLLLGCCGTCAVGGSLLVPRTLVGKWIGICIRSIRPIRSIRSHRRHGSQSQTCSRAVSLSVAVQDVAVALQLELVEIHLAAERNLGTRRAVLWLPALTQGGSRARVEFLLAVECHQCHQSHQRQVLGVVRFVEFRVFQISQSSTSCILVRSTVRSLAGRVQPSVQELENGQAHWLAGPLLIL